MENRLDRPDWLRAARLALLHRGVEGVRVEPLARDLGVTKGSFYWHFADRGDLLETLLSEWEAEESLLSDAQDENPNEALKYILEEVRRRTLASEQGDWPSDVAIFAWAAVNPAIARRVNRAEEKRMELLRGLAGRPEVADLIYYAYQGFLLRRRRMPKAAKDFDLVARMAVELFPSRGPELKPRRSLSRVPTAAKTVATLAILAIAGVAQGCTTYRILRWRDPAPDIQHKIFSERVVRHAEVPFQFATAVPRNDLDTVSVRDTDGKLKPFGTYLTDRRIRAFVVVRNDSIIYQRYLGGYKPSSRWSSFSIAKSVTSAVLGLAVERGMIESLDDPVTKYLPVLGRNASYNGVTLRHLVEMKSGMAYTRTTGDLLNDLRSSDAHFYYTGNMMASLAGMRREAVPGTEWAYKDSDSELLGWILASVAKRPVAAQLEDAVWRRIGTEHDATFSLDRRGGLDKVSAGFNATALDYARFARLYLNRGEWNGSQLLPRDWVTVSTTLDTSRSEPEVTTWYRMQHNRLWWIPMNNWNAERDFFADGSRGQRLYVHPPTRTIIVQLADDSEQEFPFRKVAHYLAGEEYRYPSGITGFVRRAAEAHGADSARAVFTQLIGEYREHPDRYTINEASFLALGESLIATGKRIEGIAVLEMAAHHYSRSWRARGALDRANRQLIRD
ncbi:MAG: serine hydrolase [Gemmatimonadaceae bacterium]|nr:serine hydrolase [Gemmatimonadaceae bacterium]